MKVAIGIFVGALLLVLWSTYRRKNNAYELIDLQRESRQRAENKDESR